MARRRSDDDFAQEVEAHIRIEADRLAAEGLTPKEADARARRAFGNVTGARERFYEARRIRWVDEVRTDVRSAWRNLRRAPVAALVIVLSLAGGIGAATAALVVRNVIFYNPPPLYHEPERLSRVQAAPADRVILPGGSDVPAGLFMYWRQEVGAEIAAAGPGRTADVRALDRIDTVAVRPVTANLFAALGVQPIAGRAFDPTQTEPATAEAILSYRAWMRVFDGRGDAVGTAITLDGQPYVVIGVMPERFWFGDTNSPIWVRLDERQTAPTATLRTVARRPAGATHAALIGSLDRGLQAYNAARAPGQPLLHIRVSPVRGTPLSEMIAPVLPYMLGVAVLLVLLTGCANAAILLIAQWASRETDTAVRASLGANRGRLIRTLLTEAVLLGLLAGAPSVLVVLGLRWWILQQSGGAGTMLDLSIPPQIVLQAAGLAFTAGILAGLAPALYETRRLQVNPLRGLQSSDRTRQRWSHGLVVLEIAITVALLVVTSSLVAGYQRLRDAQFGFDLDPLVFTSIVSDDPVHTSVLLDRIAALPEVEAAAIGTGIPLFFGRASQTAAADAAGTGAVRVMHAAISADYFDALGVPLRAGRMFGPAAAADQAVVNEALARRLFGTSDVVERQVWVGDRVHEVVGVVADFATTYAEADAIDPKLYVPLPPQSDSGRLMVLLRARGNPAASVPPLRRTLRELLPEARVADPNSYAQMMGIVTQEWLLTIAPLGPLVTMGMLLSAAGIYGVLAFAVARRARELAIRAALGASGREQVALITTRSLRLVLFGAAGGVAFTFALSRVVRAMGGGGSMYDPPWGAFLLPVVIMLVVSAAATWVPSLRASRINPAALLRTT